MSAKWHKHFAAPLQLQSCPDRRRSDVAGSGRARHLVAITVPVSEFFAVSFAANSSGAPGVLFTLFYYLCAVVESSLPCTKLENFWAARFEK